MQRNPSGIGAMAGQVMQPELNEALARLWKQFLPQIHERVDALELAGRDLSAGALTDAARDAAHAAAHKLAGVLGTFGLTRGTVLAREAEMLCAGDADPASAAQLAEIAAQLRALIKQRA
jgi:HPt (histidine-containing phosphotransfer) domain-containing protein